MLQDSKLNYGTTTTTVQFKMISFLSRRGKRIRDIINYSDNIIDAQEQSTVLILRIKHLKFTLH
jgi:hypothetical protein